MADGMVDSLPEGPAEFGKEGGSEGESLDTAQEAVAPPEPEKTDACKVFATEKSIKQEYDLVKFQSHWVKRPLFTVE